MPFLLKIALALVVAATVSLITQNHLFGLGGLLAVMAIPERAAS